MSPKGSFLICEKQYPAFHLEYISWIPDQGKNLSIFPLHCVRCSLFASQHAQKAFLSCKASSKSRTIVSFSQSILFETMLVHFISPDSFKISSGNNVRPCILLEFSYIGDAFPRNCMPNYFFDNVS